MTENPYAVPPEDPHSPQGRAGVPEVLRARYVVDEAFLRKAVHRRVKKDFRLLYPILALLLLLILVLIAIEAVRPYSSTVPTLVALLPIAVLGLSIPHLSTRLVMRRLRRGRDIFGECWIEVTHDWVTERTETSSQGRALHALQWIEQSEDLLGLELTPGDSLSIPAEADFEGLDFAGFCAEFTRRVEAARAARSV